MTSRAGCDLLKHVKKLFKHVCFVLVCGGCDIIMGEKGFVVVVLLPLLFLLYAVRTCIIDPSFSLKFKDVLYSRVPHNGVDLCSNLEFWISPMVLSCLPTTSVLPLIWLLAWLTFLQQLLDMVICHLLHPSLPLSLPPSKIGHLG